MAFRELCVIDDPRFDLHAPTAYHPERAERLAAVRAGLEKGARKLPRRSLDARPALPDEIARVHSEAHAQRLARAFREGPAFIDADTYVVPGTERAARAAAGASVELGRYLMDGEPRAGIALLRPPGHHATRDLPMGFCFYNNVAIAAHAAIARGAARVAIVDWDVHHGNGTQDAFYEDPRVLFVSLHEAPLYPDTGRATEIGTGAGAGYTINIALPKGAGPAAYGHAFSEIVLPTLGAYRPDLVLVSAGFDAHARDPLGHMNLDANAFGAMTSALLGTTSRIGVVLEGGYDLTALSESVSSVAEAIEGRLFEFPSSPPPRDADRDAIAHTRDALSPYWSVLSTP